MDPLSVSASVAGLVTLADGVFRKVYKYLKAAKGAKKEIQDLSNKTRDLAGILHNLSITITAFEDEKFDQNIRMHHLNSCRHTLMQIDEKLIKAQCDFESGKKIDSVYRRLKWPFSLSETRELFETLGRHQETISLALSADSLTAILQCLTRQNAIQDQMDEIQVGMKRALSISTRIEMDRERQTILDYFATVNPEPNLEISLKLRHPMTGLWLTEGNEFRNWLQTEEQKNSKQSKLWLSGIPGAGKTVLAGSIIEESLAAVNIETAVGYFFCDYKNNHSLVASNILGTLAAQVAKQNDEAYMILQKYHKELHPTQHFSKPPTLKGLNQVLQNMAKKFAKLFIIVDGLDECGDEMDTVVDELHSLATHSDSINMALLSRDEHVIRTRLYGDFTHVEIAAHREDLQLYVAAEIESRVKTKKLRIRSTSFQDQIIARLVEKSNGMFRWAACQIDHLCELPNDRARRQALDHLPPTLNATYERILERVNNSSSHNRTLVQKVLQLLAWDNDWNRITAAEICVAVSITEDMTSLNRDSIVDIDEVLLRCGSLIRTSPNGKYLQFAHFSVREFLEGEIVQNSTSLSSYYLSYEKGGRLLAEAGLQLLTFTEFSNTLERTKGQLKRLKNRNRRYCFYSLACITLPSLLSPQLFEDSTILGLAKTLFHPNKTPNLVAWAANICLHYRHPLPIAAEPKKYSLISSSSSDTLESPWPETDCSQLSTAQSDSSSTDHHKEADIFFSLLRADFTPLHFAASLGLAPICQYLIEEGADVNTRSQFGTPIHLAIAGPSAFNDGDIWPEFMFSSHYFHYESRIAIMKRLSAAGASGIDLIRTKSWRHHCSLVALRVSSTFRDWSIFSYLMEQKMHIDDEAVTEYRRICDNFFISYGHDYHPCQRKTKADPGAEVLLRHANEMVSTIISLTKDSRSNDPQASQLYAIAWGLGAARRLPSILIATEKSLSSHAEMSDDMFFNAMMMAVTEDNVKLLKEGFKEARIKEFQAWNPQKNTLVHIAAGFGSIQCLKLLLDSGNDVNLQNTLGQLPIHACSIDDNEDILRVLVSYGISTTSKDKAYQANIWHHAAEFNSIQILRILTSIVPHPERTEALNSVSKSGHTPLTTALQAGHGSASLLLLEYCRDKAAFSAPLSIYRYAASIGSESLITKILAADISTELKPGEPSPLHFITYHASLSCVKNLISTFSHTMMDLCEGRNIVESYINRELKFLGNHTSVSREFLTSSEFQANNALLANIWECFCSPENLGTYLYVPDTTKKAEEVLKVLELLLELGVMRAYEDGRGMPGLFPLAKAIVAHFTKSALRPPRQFPARRHGLSPTTTPKIPKVLLRPEPAANLSIPVLPALPPPRYGLTGHANPKDAAVAPVWGVALKVLRKSQYLEKVIKEPVMVQFLEFAIRANSRTLCMELLSLGLGIHHDKGYTILKSACETGTLCDSALFKDLIDLADPQRLDEIHPGTGLGLIHFLGSYGVTDAAAKLEMLINAGANPDLRTLQIDTFPALVHYLINYSNTETDMCVLLLKLGADPSCRSFGGYDAALGASLSGNEEFLRELLAYSNGFRKAISWTATASIFAGIPDQHVSSCSALHLAAYGDHVECARFYLDNEFIRNVDIEAMDGITPLWLAARHGNTAMAKFLIDRGANIDIETTSGRVTPLHVAVQNQQSQVVGILVARRPAQTRDASGFTPADYAQQLGSVEMLEMLTAGLYEPEDAWNMSPSKDYGKYMEAAIRRGNDAICESLLQRGCPIDVKMPSCCSCTPLLLAIQLENVPLANLFLEKGASARVIYCEKHKLPSRNAMLPVDMICRHNTITSPLLKKTMDRFIAEGGGWLSFTYNPLHVAIESQNKTAVVIILEHSRHNAATYAKNSGVAVRNSELPHRVVKMLVDQEEEFDDNDNETWPLLHKAVEVSDLTVVKLLAEHHANLNITDDLLKTPLHIAAMKGKQDIIEFLVKSGANMSLRDCWGQTPLAQAVYHLDLTVIKTLINLGADFTVRDSHGRNLICVAAKTLKSCPEKESLYNYLLDLGLDPWEPDDGGKCAVHYALSRETLMTVILRRNLFKGAPPISSHCLKFNDDWLWSEAHILIRLQRCYSSDVVRAVIPLQIKGQICRLSYSVKTDYVTLVECLVNLGADIEHEGCVEGTALMGAAAFGCFKVVKWLVRKGARISYVSIDGTFHSAVKFASPFPKIVDWLLIRRFTDQSMLEYSPRADMPGELTWPWSGITVGQLPLLGWRARRRDESSIEFARRLSEIRNNWLGYVLPDPVTIGNPIDSGP